METQRNFLLITMLVLAAILWMKWTEFSTPDNPQKNSVVEVQSELPVANIPNIDAASPAADNSDELPTAPQTTPPAAAVNEDIASQPNPSPANLIQVDTDLVKATINPQGAVLEGLQLIEEPISIEQPNVGFPLLRNTATEKAVLQDGLVTVGQPAPNHANTLYQTAKTNYQLGSSDELRIPLTWVSDNGIKFTKTFIFKRDSYVVDIEYRVNNLSNEAWQGSIYGQFQSTETVKKGGGFGQLPSYAGAAVYTEDEKYEKISFKDMNEENYKHRTDTGWVAMLQHYFVAAWIPQTEGSKEFYSSVSKNKNPVTFRVGYKNEELTRIEAGASGLLQTSVYLGPKTQKRLKLLESENGVNGLALTVDYGALTFIADPLFIVLSWIHGLVGNWGWAIILLTILIKIVFYPLSAASYKSMAGMKKLQPRIQTLKERYKEDRPKFQTEMMALYKKEKINPAGGCLPILVQIPVFIALYWVLLESVEMRQAPFALWLQDLSSPDPFYILPVLMGASMWAQQKLNPAPMDDIQKKVMMVMPIALTFLFLTFPQGLVLYWVVNNLLSIAQQWLINRRLAV